MIRSEESIIKRRRQNLRTLIVSNSLSNSQLTEYAIAMNYEKSKGAFLHLTYSDADRQASRIVRFRSDTQIFLIGLSVGER